MKRTTWIVLDFVLSAVVAFLGKWVASYLQTRFNLDDPFRFIFVAAAFAICLGLSLFITLKKQGGTVAPPAKPSQPEVQNSTTITVSQNVKRVEKGGSVTGININRR